MYYLPNCFGNFGAGCFLAFLPGPIGVASVDHLLENLFFLPITTEDTENLEGSTHVCLTQTARPPSR